ncbi:MAG: Do family serine endopeptidase [Spirochaetales bacterium]|nr:Do family serine endopeptidase [Spirochaetales bacterium]
MTHKIKQLKRISGRAAALAMLILFLTLTLGADGGDRNEQISQGVTALENIQNAFHLVAGKVIPTVVEVEVTDVVKAPAFQSPFDFFFDSPEKNNSPDQREYRRYGLGSGIIVQRNGDKVYVLTNYHVAGEAEEINIKLSDKREFKASLVGTDDKKDLALLVFETGEQVPIAELGDSDDIHVGDWVLAVGNPFGFSSTITSGIISAVGRESAVGASGGNFTEYIQTDAAINQGNSGGALVNIKGQVIGINAWIASPSGGNVGIGFAIPINNAKQDIKDFLTKGKVEYGWLGITMGGIVPEAAQDLKVEGKGGALVYGLFKDSPAFKAGVLPGDFITAVNGKEVKDSSQLLHMIGSLAPGVTTRLTLIRDAKEINMNVTLAVRGDEKTIIDRAGKIWPGFSVVPITPDIAKQLKLKSGANGVVIAQLDNGSAALTAGLKPGDVIIKINEKKVENVRDFYRVLNQEKNHDVRFRILRDNTELIIGLVR